MQHGQGMQAGSVEFRDMVWKVHNSRKSEIMAFICKQLSNSTSFCPFMARKNTVSTLKMFKHKISGIRPVVKNFHRKRMFFFNRCILFNQIYFVSPTNRLWTTSTGSHNFCFQCKYDLYVYTVYRVCHTTFDSGGKRVFDGRLADAETLSSKKKRF